MRKTALICTGFIASLMFTHYFGKVSGFALCLLLVISAAVFLFKSKNAVFIPLVACAFLLGNIIMGYVDTRFELLGEKYDRTKFDATVSVVEVLENSRAYVKVETLDGVKQGAFFNVLCKFETGTALQKGDLIKLELSLNKIENSDKFPSKLYNEGMATVLEAKATNAKLISSSFIWSIHTKLVSYIESVFDKYLGEYADLSKGLFLGSKTALDEKENDILSSLGIIHVLSVSGLHFAILLGLFSALLNTFGLSKGTSCCIVAVFAIFYMFLTGFSQPVCRSGIMSFFVIFDYLIERNPDKLTTLSVTGALMCLANPTCAINLSFQLSFLATFGLIAASNCISVPLKVATDEKPLGKPVRDILSSFVYSLSALFFCLAPLSYSFKNISALSPAGNLLCTPFAEFILVLAFLIIPLSVLPHIAGVFGFIGQGVGKIFTFLCEILNNERFMLTLDNGALVYVSAFLTAFCALLFLVPFKNKKAALLVFITGSTVLCVIS